jgi:GWxTD domain-containing protein
MRRSIPLSCVFPLLLVLASVGPGATDRALATTAGDSLRAAAEDRLFNGRPGEAVSLLKQLISDGFAEAEDYVQLGQAYLAKGDRKRGKRAFKKAMDEGAVAAGCNGLGLVEWQSKGGQERALKYFEKALSRDPGFADAQYNIAVVYQELRPVEAMGAFEKVLEIDPHHPDAYYRIGRLQETVGDTSLAMTTYLRQIEVYPGHGRARYRLWRLLLSRGQEQEARDTFEDVLAVEGRVRARVYMEMGVLSERVHQYGTAQRLFEAYIEHLPEQEQRVYQDISLVSSADELALYRNAPDDQKGEVARKFWKFRDPTPLTDVNERQVEHYRRVAVCRERFSAGEFPWDDRGEVYIRLGPPDHVSRSSDIQAEMDDDLRNARINFSYRFRYAPALVPGYPMFPVKEMTRWEYWIYAGIDGGIEFTFQSDYGGKRYDYAPVPAGVPPSLAVDLAAQHGKLVLANVTAEQPSIYSVDFADLPIDFYYYPAGFRGMENLTRLEIYYGLPASEVARLQVDAGSNLGVLDRGLVLFDHNLNEVHRVEDQIAFSMPSDQQIEQGAFIPGVLAVDLPPGSYRMALQVRDVLSEKSQVYQQEVVLEDYTGQEVLQISDIELAFSVFETEEVDEYVKDGLKVIPMSSKSYRSHHNAFVYFEIYNLKRDEFGQTKYRVEYTLRSYKKRSAPARILHGLGRLVRIAEKDEEIVIAYEQVGKRRSEKAYVELDLSETETGGQSVKVKVEDLLSKQKVEKEIRFEIVP